MPRYWCVNRPPGYAQIPAGWSDYEVWMPARKVGEWFFLGWVEYPERLTREQIWQYELRPESEIERAENYLADDDSHYVQDYQAFSDEDLEEYADRDLLAWATLVLRRSRAERSDVTIGQIAEQIYSQCFGHLDDKVFHREKVNEIENWLSDGDRGSGRSISDLVHEWTEYDADDPNVDDRVHGIE